MHTPLTRHILNDCIFFFSVLFMDDVSSPYIITTRECDLNDFCWFRFDSVTLEHLCSIKSVLSPLYNIVTGRLYLGIWLQYYCKITSIFYVLRRKRNESQKAPQNREMSFLLFCFFLYNNRFKKHEKNHRTLPWQNITLYIIIQ